MPLTIAVPALGVAQIISWGSLYYSIAVLGQDMRLGAGASETALFGGFALGLMLSGLAAPAIGKWVDARGGRVVLSAGSLLGMVIIGEGEGVPSVQPAVVGVTSGRGGAGRMRIMNAWWA